MNIILGFLRGLRSSGVLSHVVKVGIKKDKKLNPSKSPKAVVLLGKDDQKQRPGCIKRIALLFLLYALKSCQSFIGTFA